MTSPSSEKNVPIVVTKGQNPIQMLQNEINSLFGGFFNETLPHWWRSSESMMPFGLYPATDVTETDKGYKITVELPGMEAKDVNVSVNEGYVTIQGKKEESFKEEKAGYYRQERSFGDFTRIVPLPPHLANMDNAEASTSKGLLTILVPKKADTQSKSRILEVKQAA